MFAHSFEEAWNSRPHEDVDLADLALDFDREDDVGVLNRLELGVDKSFVKV